MRGINKMYSMKPLIRHDLQIELPICMYQMKNIHSGRNGEVISDTGHVSEGKGNLDTFDQKNQQLPEMVEVVQHQERILQQLADLKKQMLSLRETLKSNPSSRSSSSTACSINRNIVKCDSYSAVININPSRPPYFLEILQKLLKNTVNISVAWHVHSSVPNAPNAVIESLQRLQQNSTQTSNGLATITLRVILKEVHTQAQLLISSVPIVGEVNILRYLARTLPNLHYEDGSRSEIDHILDACYCIVEATTKTERAKHIQTIFKKLGKSPWLSNSNQYTIADVAVYFTFKNFAENELNVTLTKYIQKCKATFDN